MGVRCAGLWRSVRPSGHWDDADPIGGFLNFSVDPDQSEDWGALNNNPRNLFWYHKLGNVGMIGYSGGATWEESKPDFQVSFTRVTLAHAGASPEWRRKHAASWQRRRQTMCCSLDTGMAPGMDAQWT
eukprot:scaffold1007_cov381-Pinguiococcus_pyrenoidosus.AAC.3